MASTVSDEEAGNERYQDDHMRLIFAEGFSFSGFERDALFLNLQGKGFKDISGVSGIDSILDGRAVVLADFDNDGDLDVFLTTIQGEGHLLFRNNVGQENRFLRVSLEGTASGKDAFGAIVRLKTSQGIQTQVKSGGHGFLASHDPRLLFGMGEDETAEWIEVFWPSGNLERFGPVRAASSLKLVERSAERELLTDRRLQLPEPVGPHEALWSRLKIRKGERLPSLSLRRLHGDTLGEPGILEPGRRYFINLWATYCGPCRQEMPELEKLRPHFEEQGIQLVGVSLDESPAGVQEFAHRLGVRYPLYLIDPAELDRIYAGGHVFIPLSILLDAEGRVSEVFAGWSRESEQHLRRTLGLSD